MAQFRLDRFCWKSQMELSGQGRGVPSQVPKQSERLFGLKMMFPGVWLLDSAPPPATSRGCDTSFELGSEKQSNKSNSEMRAIAWITDTNGTHSLSATAPRRGSLWPSELRRCVHILRSTDLVGASHRQSTNPLQNMETRCA